MTRKIGILRLSHRHFRDQRMTTHVALTARALGADSFAYTGEHDINMENSLRDIVTRFGGNFSVTYLEGYAAYMKQWQGKKVHLTMYGENHRQTIAKLQDSKNKDLLIIVGGAKVPIPVYKLADYNTAIGHQPHSEIGAVAIFMTELLGTDKLYTVYPDAQFKVEPNSKG